MPPSFDHTATCENIRPAVSVRGVHLDLKGLAPTFDRLMQLLEHFAHMRFNAILVEWEDTFPWQFDPSIQGRFCYSRDQIHTIARRCDDLGLTLIPLIQSLGHLEMVLKHPQYAHLRELPHRTDCLNPLAQGASELLITMIDEMLDTLPGVKWLHLGGDEAWSFGSHPQTDRYIRQHGNDTLYRKHMTPLLDHIATRDVRPILWHDMMADWPVIELADFTLKTDLMVWGYRGTPDDRRHHHSRETLNHMAKAHVTMWGGSAYKGADGPHCDLPDQNERLRNQQGWANASAQYNMRGVIATGWSRYAHARIQVEPIDACLRELAMTALVLHDNAWPHDGWEQCDNLLQRLGEKEQHDILRKHLQTLQDTRTQTWLRAQQLKEHLACQVVEPQRGDGGMAGFLFEHFEPWVTRVEKLTRELQQMLTPLVGSAQAHAYGQARAAALRFEADQLQNQIRLADAGNSCPTPGLPYSGELRLAGE